MCVITISSDSYRKGAEVAEKTAESLGYKYVGREILASVSAKYGIPQAELIKALDESPSLFGMSSKTQALCLAYIEEAALAELAGDNVVSYGVAAHLYVAGVSHVLRVRFLAEPQALACEVSSQERVTVERAAAILKRRESERRRWSLKAFRQDETDPSLYDLVINLSQIDPEEAVKTVADTAAYRKFRPMSYSVKCMKDKELASKVRATLIGRFPGVRVRADGATIVVETNGLRRERRKKAEAIKGLAGKIEGVGYVEVHVVNDIFRQAAESFR